MATLTGTPFDDTLSGGDGDDRIAGLAGRDLLLAGGGADALDGGDGFLDGLFGGAGDDLLRDPDGAASVYGGAGADTIDIAFAQGWRNEAGSAVGPAISGDRGDDWISVTLADPAMEIELVGDPRGDSGAFGGNDTIVVAGTYGLVIGDLGAGDDVFRGGDFRDNADGGAGRDYLDGSGGADNLAGGSEDDLVAGGSGGDALSGGDGFLDTLLGGADDDLLSDADGVGMAAGGRGNDTINLIFSAEWDDDDFAGTEAVVDGISGDLGDDSILFYGGSGAAIVILGDGAAPSAGDGDDTILISPDAFYSGSTILAGGGHDDVTGSNGRDMVVGGDGFDVIIGREGADTLDGGADGDFLVGGVDADLLIGQTGHDSLWGDQFLGFGGGGTTEGDGADTLLGGPGDDVIVAGGGADLAYGGSGRDALYGGREGSTAMFGGLGDDSYYIGVGDGTATIVEDGTDDADDYLVFYWGSGSGPYQRLGPDDVRIFDNEDGTWGAFFLDGSGGTTFTPGAIRRINIYDVGENLMPGGGDDRVFIYVWDGSAYV